MVSTRLDLRGEICPYTELRAKRSLETLAAGTELVIDIDHVIAARTIPEMATHTGLGEVVAVESQGEGRFRIVLRRL